MSIDFKPFLDAGYVEDEEAKSELVASTAHMHATGPYVVLGVLRKGMTLLQFEQNTSAEQLSGGLTATVTHPPVCVIASLKGRTACNATDTDLILAIADDLST